MNPASVRVMSLLGKVSDARFDGRRTVAVPVAWDEAARRRLRRAAADGTDLVIDLARPAYLADGAVLHDDGARIFVVVRTPEPALVVRFDPAAPPGRLVAQALALGHAFGNQHVPIDVADGEVAIPLTTSEAVARGTVDGLHLDAVTVEVTDVALGRERPLPVGHASGGGHASHAHGSHADHARVGSDGA